MIRITFSSLFRNRNYDANAPPNIEDDCGTTRGVEMRALVEGGEVIQALRDRVLGRVTAVDVINPDTHEVVIAAGTLLDERLCDKLDEVGIDMVKVRTPLTCDTRYGLCAKCYGRDLGRCTLVNAGESVGVIAAQSIGEPGILYQVSYLLKRH